MPAKSTDVVPQSIRSLAVIADRLGERGGAEDADRDRLGRQRRAQGDHRAGLGRQRRAKGAVGSALGGCGGTDDALARHRFRYLLATGETAAVTAANRKDDD